MKENPNIKTHSFTTPKTARYSTFGQLNEKTKYFWFVLHGSKMQCEQMLYKFENFNPQEHFVVAPEALSRFYLKGFGGDVVAAWMTKRDRLHEIEDFSVYLSGLYNTFSGQLPNHCKKIVLGFSQGGTTMFRWLHHTKEVLDHLVAYSCWIPEDINLKEAATNLREIHSLYTIGNQDEYFNPQNRQGLNSVISSNGLKIEMLEYEGDHRIDKNQLNFIFNNYIR